MVFANPYWLWLLGLIPVLIIIHSLKPKPKIHEVADLFLWREAVRQKGGGLSLQRLFMNASMLLQILAVILAAAALADPVFTFRAGTSGNVILVIDASASMKTRSGAAVRFDQARKKALNILDDLPAGAKMMIIEAGAEPRIKCPFIDDKPRLERILQDIEALDVPGRLDKSVFLALSFLDPGRGDAVFVITDGAGGEYSRISGLQGRIHLVPVAGGDRNIGIIRFKVRPEPVRTDRYEIMVEVKNFNRQPVLCPLKISLGRKPILEKTFGLKAMEKRVLIFPYAGRAAGNLEASIGLKDDFEVDNKAYAVLGAERNVWVLLVSKGNYFLESLLRIFPNFMINSIDDIKEAFWTRQVQGHDLIILDRVSPPDTASGNFLLINSFSPSLPLTKVGETGEAAGLVWDRRNPIMADVDLSRLYIGQAAKVKAGPGLTPLLESQETGLIYSYDKEDLRAVFMGFDLDRSDLPLRVAYPVLMNNIFRWLYSEPPEYAAGQVKAGQSFHIRLAGAGRFSIRTPDERWEKHRSDAGSYIYRGTDRVGLYAVIEDQNRRSFAVNLEDEAESNIRTPEMRKADPESEADLALIQTRARQKLWPYLMAALFLIVISEWFVWSRRQR